MYKFSAMEEFTTREQIVEIVNKLFVFTDSRNWSKLQNEVFEEEVKLDMSSLGGPNDTFSANAICDMWQEGFKDLDAVNHLGGNYLVDVIDPDRASVFAYATVTHYKETATKGKTREFVGTYDLGFRRGQHGWKINSFTYQLKYLSGNVNLE